MSLTDVIGWIGVWFALLFLLAKAVSLVRSGTKVSAVGWALTGAFLTASAVLSIYRPGVAPGTLESNQCYAIIGWWLFMLGMRAAWRRPHWYTIPTTDDEVDDES